jgi:DNA-binding LytR/AlgR family response regulator
MKLINCLIIDDEPQARKLLENMVSQLSGWQIVALCSSALEAFEIIQENKVDILFLDINMPAITGLDFLRSLEKPPLVIFTTAHNQYAMEGYELNVVDYLLKPVSMHRFLQAAGKVQERITRTNIHLDIEKQNPVSYLFLRHDNKLVKVNFDGIFYIEGMQNFVRIHTEATTYIVNQTMKSMQDLLPTGEFIRIHKSYIVSMKAVTAVFGNTVEIANIQLPIGSNYKETFMNYIER